MSAPDRQHRPGMLPRIRAAGVTLRDVDVLLDEGSAGAAAATLRRVAVLLEALASEIERDANR